ncbi:hypothetical protein F4703DRAFT_1797840 [Phycomyces blakesleeanus]
MPAGILTMELAATEGLSRETEADVWGPFPCPKPAQMALCIVHTLTLPLLHFYIPPFFFDTRVLTSSDASSSQWPSGLAKAILPKILSTIKHGHQNGNIKEISNLR